MEKFALISCILTRVCDRYSMMALLLILSTTIMLYALISSRRYIYDRRPSRWHPGI